MRKLFIFLTLISLFSCGKNYEISECSKKCDRIIKNYCRKLRQDGLKICGTGGGLNEDNTKVNLIELSLLTNVLQDIDSARRLIITETESLLSFLNEQEDFRDCMIKYPYPAKSLKIFILCDVPEEDNKNYVRAVGVGCCKVKYFRSDDSRGLNGIKLVHEETYEEAKQILANQTQE